MSDLKDTRETVESEYNSLLFEDYMTRVDAGEMTRDAAFAKIRADFAGAMKLGELACDAPDSL